MLHIAVAATLAVSVAVAPRRVDPDAPFRIEFQKAWQACQSEFYPHAVPFKGMQGVLAITATNATHPTLRVKFQKQDGKPVTAAELSAQQQTVHGCIDRRLVASKLRAHTTKDLLIEFGIPPEPVVDGVLALAPAQQYVTAMASRVRSSCNDTALHTLTLVVSPQGQVVRIDDTGASDCVVKKLGKLLKFPVSESATEFMVSLVATPSSK